MFRADDYVKVSSLAEAYELCQKRSSLVVGGMVWLKMTSVTKRTVIDLSVLDWTGSKKTTGKFSVGSHVQPAAAGDPWRAEYIFGVFLRELYEAYRRRADA